MEYCFAYQQNQIGHYICKAIMDKCDGKNTDCPFYKTEAKQKADRQAAFEHIAKLPLEVQESIATQYYGGSKPWLCVAPKPGITVTENPTEVDGVV